MGNFSDVLTDRGLPASVQAERTILGAMMLDAEAFHHATSRLSTLDFSLDSHRRIYGAYLRLVEDGNKIDIITAIEELDRSKELHAVGDRPYLFSLTENLPRRLNIEEYVRIVKGKSLLRQIMTICQDGMARAVDQSEDATDIMADVQLKLMELTADAGINDAEDVGQIIPEVLKKIGEQRLLPHWEDALGFTTGIRDLDKKTKGLYPNEYTLIGAETGGAKTAWATQITVENAIKGVRVHWFSQEMTKEQLTKRILVYASKKATAKDVRDPRYMTVVDWADLQDTGTRMSMVPISIDDTRQLPLDKLLAKAQVAIRKEGAKIIVVDYIQLVQSAAKKRQTDTERIEAVTLALRDLAADSKKYGVHVIGLSQYARPNEARAGGARNSRAKGSSSLEQSAQNFFHITREQTETGEWAAEGEIVIGKSREGTLGRVPFLFDGDHLKFNNAPHDHERGE